MTTKVDEPLSTTPVVGTPARTYAPVLEPWCGAPGHRRDPGHGPGQR